MLNILQYDPYLEPYKEDLSYRLFEFSRTKKRLLGMEGNLQILPMVINILAFNKKRVLDFP